MNRESPIAPVTGWPAMTLSWRGGVLQMSAGACVIPLALESVLPGRWYYWAIIFGAICFVLVTVGTTMVVMSSPRSKKEVERGYTTICRLAIEHPELTYLSPYDFDIISGPGEPRPRNGTRKVVDQFRAQQGTQRPAS